MSGPELKPCPLCGGEARLVTHRTGEDSIGAYVYCCACDAHSPHFEDAHAPRAEAIAAWNTRAPVNYAALPEVQGLIAGAYEAAAREIDVSGDPAVTEALGQQLCCSGHMCGCQGADVGTYLLHLIRALTPADAIAARDAMIAEAVAKEREACAKEAEDHLKDWSADLAHSFGSYIAASSSGQHNGRKMKPEMALKFAAEFRQRAEAVAESAEHTAAAIRNRGEGM